MSAALKKIWNTMTSIIVFIAIVLAFLLIGVKMFNLDTYIVLSGSMEPAYPTGSLIYVQKANPNELKAGDVITFHMSGNVVVTHRIIDITDQGFVTKGDANEVVDSFIVPHDYVIGAPKFVIPYLGYLASYLQQPSGFYSTLSLSCLLVLMVFIPDLFPDKRKERKQ